jgi:Flp pilus assembly protein TadB
MRTLLPSLLAGALVGGGLTLLVAAVARIPLTDPASPSLLRKVAANRRTISTRLAGAVAGGAVTLLLTRWIVFAVGIGLLIAYWDRIVGSAAGERVAIARIEALAVWTESLRDTIAGAIGLEQAIPSSANAAPPVIRPSLNLLVDRLRIREPLPNALMAFAEDLDDPSADTVVAALVLNARLRGPGLRDVLTALAGSVREELDMRRRIEAGRRSIRRSVRIILVIVLGVVGLLAVFNRDYVQPYDSVVGQVMLVVVAVVFMLGLLWLRKLAKPVQTERFLVGTPVAVRAEVAAAQGTTR